MKILIEKLKLKIAKEKQAHECEMNKVLTDYTQFRA